MKIIKYRNYFLAFSGTLTVIAILLWIMWGLKLGIDFTGGSLLQIQYAKNVPTISEIKSELTSLNLKGLEVQAVGNNGFNLRFQDTGEDVHQKVLTALEGTPTNSASNSGVKVESTSKANVAVTGTNVSVTGTNVSANTQPNMTEVRFDSVGPSIGAELKTKAFYAIIFVVVAIVLYIAFAFRKVSYPVSSWKYGIAAILALIHDSFVTIGIFVILGKFWGFEVNTPFVAALLTIFGYSVHDTIVVFDRIRENLHKYEGEFDEIVEKSIWETMARSINTIVTVELALLALLIFGGGSINDFVLPLLIGFFFGGYSSIFIASQILVAWQKFDWAMKKSQG